MKKLAILLIVCVLLFCVTRNYTKLEAVTDLLSTEKIQAIKNSLQGIRLPTLEEINNALQWVSVPQPEGATKAPEDDSSPSQEDAEGPGTVRTILQRANLTKTAAPVTVGSICQSDCDSYYGANLVQEMSRHESNPIALFRVLVDEGVYRRHSQSKGAALKVCYHNEQDAENPLYMIPNVVRWDKREESDPDTLLCEMLRMSSFVEECTEMSTALLNAYEYNGVEAFQYSAENDCYYNYSIECCKYDRANVMAVYLRDPTEDGQFQDVEIQFMQIYFRDICAAGGSLIYQMAAQAWQTQTAAMICATEKLIAGESYLSQKNNGEHCDDEYVLYRLPGSYTLGEYRVEVNAEEYDCVPASEEGFDAETVQMINYRIRSTK